MSNSGTDGINVFLNASYVHTYTINHIVLYQQ